MLKKILLTAMTAVLLFTTGCDPQQPPVDKPDKPKPVQTENTDKKVEPETKEKPAEKKDTAQKFQTQEIKVFFPDDSGMKLVAVARTIKFVDESEKYSAALSELMQTPKEEGLTNIFPKHTKIKNVSRMGDTVIVDFDKDIAKNFVGGSTGEEFLVNSIVNTLTEFNEVNQVRFLIDGKEIETIAGHMDLSEPVKKIENEE
ncbi:MAG: GerMN domain-containing protein [Selenomonadaceae bacterium]|nr:GerMN domain-containing protein [Selenomonadaceae bacterium]